MQRPLRDADPSDMEPATHGRRRHSRADAEKRGVSEVEIYTDGACRGNPGPGGWGALLVSGERRREMRGAESNTTNNRMELTAAIEALAALTRPCRVRLFTDSQYCARNHRVAAAGKARGQRRRIVSR
jgi:ribonuclease HI